MEWNVNLDSMRWASASGPSPFRAGVVWSGRAWGVPGFTSQRCWPHPAPALSGVFLSSLAYFLRSSRAADTLWPFLTTEGPGGEDGDRPGSMKRLGGCDKNNFYLTLLITSVDFS